MIVKREFYINGAWVAPHQPRDCAVIDPSVITTRFAHVDVETSGELTMGRTVCDFRFSGRTPAEANFAFLPPNVEFALDADEPKFVGMLLDILGCTA